MILGIIQARMGSTRLPGKALKKINGIPLLKYQIDRVADSGLMDKLVIATTDSDKDDEIVSVCRDNGIEYFRGSENDVLARFYECARRFKADVIVRLTADCPLSDPAIVDDVIDLYLKSGVDYAANTIPPQSSRYPDGTDVEVFSMNALERAYNSCDNPCDREHVTFYFWKYGNEFTTRQLDNKEDWSKFRFTVDYSEDFEVVEYILKELKRRNSFGHAAEVIEILNANDPVKMKNSKYFFGIGWGDKK